MNERSKNATWPRGLRRFSPVHWLTWAGDGRDRRDAERRRADLGHRGWLVSWHREPDGRWRARLSGPYTVCTIERTARTRCRAIERAWQACHGMLLFRATNGPSRPRLDDVGEPGPRELG